MTWAHGYVEYREGKAPCRALSERIYLQFSTHPGVPLYMYTTTGQVALIPTVCSMLTLHEVKEILPWSIGLLYATVHCSLNGNWYVCLGWIFFSRGSIDNIEFGCIKRMQFHNRNLWQREVNQQCTTPAIHPSSYWSPSFGVGATCICYLCVNPLPLLRTYT